MDSNIDFPLNICMVYLRWFCYFAIDHVLVPATNDKLAGDSDLLQVVVADWTALLITIVENYGDCGFSDSSLTLLVD
jgi:hypothetical protein